MFHFNPILTFRNLYRHKSTSVISICGFTLGLVSTIFLYFYISSELSYDSFHKDGDQIYRAIRLSGINDDAYRIGVTSGPYARALENDFPSAITSSTRAYPQDGLISFGNKKFKENKLLFADANFFEFFSFPLVYGEPESVLAEANSAVISRATAKKYFGESDPIGQLLEVDNEFQFIITGIMEDPINKSHLEFDIVLTISFFDRFSWFSDWWNNGLMTYVKIPTPEMAANVGSGLADFMDKYFADDFEESGNRVDLMLEPLNDIYFNNDTRYDWARHGNINAVYILGLVAIAILFIACFNYVNLSIAQSFMRTREVGVRKVLGVRKWRLTLQFLGESFMILSIAMLFSIGICQLINPIFNRFFELQINLNWLDPGVWIFFVIVFAIILLTSGIYPAILLSSFRPIAALKGSKVSSGRSGIRKGLVISQFAISIFLIITTLLIAEQNNYMNTKDLGFRKDAVILVDLDNSEIRRSGDVFKERLLNNTNVIKASNVSGEPGGFHDASSFKISGLEENVRMRTLFADTDYLELFEIELMAGRDFSLDLDSDTANVMIFNEQAVKELGLTPEELIGRKASMPGWGIENSSIVGIVSDFHFSTLKDEVEPLAIICGRNQRRLAVKMNPEYLKEGLLFIEQTYKEISPEFPMSYEFLDESLAQLYENEEKQARVFSAFSGISIFLACLGIFGLAAYTAQQRQKELGIRKVLGATPQQIIGLISKDFIFLVIVAAIIAVPVVWFFMEKWLDDYAYRITLSDHWYFFFLGGVSAVVIALLTISFKAYRTAISDPTDSIRNE